MLQSGVIQTRLRIDQKEEELIQTKGTTDELPTQLINDNSISENYSGLPAPLKSGLESLSGFDLSGVRVHTNSSKPAQINAFACTQGQDIHLAPGQEKHLPHEGWHVVQQIQGRVKPTIQDMGVTINDDPRLEREADVMGAMALQKMQVSRNIDDAKFSAHFSQSLSAQSIQRVGPAAAAAAEGLFGIAGLEAVEAATLGLTAIPLIQGAVSQSGQLAYSADKVSRLMDKEPKPFSRRNIHYIFYASVAKPLAPNPAAALFELVVDSNDYGEMVAYVRKNMQHTDSFSKSSFKASFKSLGLYPRKGGEKDPRAWPLRYSYEGTYDPYGGGEYDFQGEFIFNAFGMFKILEHKIVNRSFIEALSAGAQKAVDKYEGTATYTVPKLPAPQRKILMQNYKKDPNYKSSP
jgi:hypothetical protein